MLFFIFHSRDIAPDGIVVRILDGSVHGTVVSPQVSAGQYIVYPEIESILVIGDAQAASGLGEGIIQLTGDGMMRIRNGGIVEVTADNDVRVPRCGNLVGDRVSLGGTDSGCFRQLADEEAYAAFHFLLFGRFQHVLIYHFVGLGQFVRFQVVVDKGKGISPYFYFIDDRAVIFAGIIEYACRKYGKFGVAGYPVGMPFASAHCVDVGVGVCL